MHLRYDLVGTDGGWRIARLAAHWELGVMIARLLRTGPSGVLAGAKLGPQLVAELGIGGAMGMMRALRGVGGSGKRVSSADCSPRPHPATGWRPRALLDERTVIELPVGHPISVAEFADRARDMEWDKMIAAGRTVSVSVRVGASRGVAFIDFAPDRPRITAVRVFLDGDPSDD